MATYDEMARDVMNWSNRSVDVLDYDRIKQCIVYAHDEIYRTLRIASMEGRFDYDPISEAQAEDGSLLIPSNTVEFIQLRKKFDGRGANSAAANRFTVAEARNDIRSFYGNATSRYSNFSYSREHDRLLVYPGLTESEEWQLYYYYRFEDPFERVSIEKDNLLFLEQLTEDQRNVLIDTDTALVTRDFFIWDGIRDDPYILGNLVQFSGNIYEVLNNIPALIEWSVNTTYAAGEFLKYEEVIYIVDTSVTGTPNWNGTEDDYEAGDIVVFGDDFYTAASAIPADVDNTDPATDTTNWTVGDAIITVAPGAADVSTTYSISEGTNPVNDTTNYEIWGEFAGGEDTKYVAGVLEENWFRDENEKALLFGALHQAFDYLDEADQSGKYKAKFEQELQKLNDEERRRQVLGGNVQTNFYSVLI